jgi:hypothetical protein
MIDIASKDPVAPAVQVAAQDPDRGSSLLAMLIAGLVLIVIGYVAIMVFV